MMNKGFKNVAFNEQEALTDVLLLEKNLVKLYAAALTESENKQIRTILTAHYKTANNSQNDTFTVMQKLGYYQTQKADKLTLDQKRESFNKMLKSM